MLPLRQKMHYTKHNKNWPCNFIDDAKNVHLYTHDDGRKPIAISYRVYIIFSSPDSLRRP